MINVPTIEDVASYISQLPNSEEFESLDEKQKNKLIFNAQETLASHYPPDYHVQLNARIVALLTLYNYEGDMEEFSKLKKHGVESYSAKDVTVRFSNSGNIPDHILEILDKLNPDINKGLRVGRLI